MAVRRIGRRIEIHTRVAGGGRTAHVMGADDLLLVVEDRAARLSCRRRWNTLPPCLLAVTEPGEVFILEQAPRVQQRVAYLGRGLLEDLLGYAGIVPPGDLARPAACVIPHADAPDAVDRIESERGLQAFLHAVVGHCRVAVRSTAGEPVGHPLVWRARKYLLDNYRRLVSLRELSAVAGMCRTALAHAFTRELGISPDAYQTHVRVMRARELIAAGHPLSDVSLEVGFTDQSHLTRHFKRVLGLTPGQCVPRPDAGLRRAWRIPRTGTLPPWSCAPGTGGDADCNDPDRPYADGMPDGTGELGDRSVGLLDRRTAPDSRARRRADPRTRAGRLRRGDFYVP